MTIVYKNKSFPPAPYDQIVIDMLFYRALYEGEHARIFPRAKYAGKDRRLKRKRVGYKRWEEYFETIETGDPYIVVNFSSLVAEIPADLINRSLGNISADTETSEEELAFVKEVAEASQINEKIWAAVVSHQVDGSIAYRPRRDESGKVWFEWLLGDQYLPHADGRGADVAWIEEWGDETNKKRFLRVERQRLGNNVLTVEQLVFKFEGDSVGDEVDAAAYAAEYGAEVPGDIELSGVTELLIGVVTNEDTLYTPRGRSALRNVAEIQEEINWTVTRDSIVFEKHGKPKLAIPKGLWDMVANDNRKNYGRPFVRNADLEVVSYNENNGAVPMYIVWDAKTEQSFEHVTRLIKYMLAVSKTSPQAAGLEDAKGDSGVALLYLWIQSVIKAESIKEKFDAAIKTAIRKCIILENAMAGTNMNPITPVIEWGDMLPKAESERNAEEAEKYSAGTQSLETTVRRMHPDWSEKAILAEIQKIQDETAAVSLPPTQVQPPRVTL